MQAVQWGALALATVLILGGLAASSLLMLGTGGLLLVAWLAADDARAAS